MKKVKFPQVRIDRLLYDAGLAATENGKKQKLQHYFNECIRLGMQKKGDLKHE